MVISPWLSGDVLVSPGARTVPRSYTSRSRPGRLGLGLLVISLKCYKELIVKVKFRQSYRVIVSHPRFQQH